MIAVIGWLGMLMLLTAYLAVSIRLLENGLVFHSLNLLGSIGIIIVSLSKEAYQPAVLNICWAIIAVSGIYTSLYPRSSAPSDGRLST